MRAALTLTLLILLFFTAMDASSRAAVAYFGCAAPKGALAYYCPSTDTIHLNERAIRADYKCGLCYFRDPTTPTGRQKTAVFALHDPDGARLRRWLAKQPDPAGSYVEFVRQHEIGHQKLHGAQSAHGAHDAQSAHGAYRHSTRRGLMHPDTLLQEMEANLYAYKALGIP